MMTDNLHVITDQSLPALVAVERIKVAGMEMREQISRFVMLENEMGMLPPESSPELTGIQEKYKAVYDSIQRDLQWLAINEDRLFSEALLSQLEVRAEGMNQTGLQVTEIQEGESISITWDDFAVAEEDFIAVVDEISAVQMEALKAQRNAMLVRTQQLIWIYSAEGILIGFLAVVATDRFYKKTMKRVDAMHKMVAGVEAGKLQVRLQDDQQDEIGQLARAMNQTADYLAKTREALEHTTTELALQLQERQATEALLAEAATHDTLTGLPNRASFFEQFNHAIALADRYQGSMALLFIDMDGLKIINDAFGHDGGDVLIQQVAQRLRKQIRKSDYVARLAGDEFVVILENLQNAEEDVALVCTKLLKMLAEPYDIRGRRIRLTASIGVSIFPEHGCNANELLRKADSAMYQVKNGGKNNYAVYVPRRK
ncbi:MAG: diguanylate cyclase [Anaerolineaceae bacterium]|nr:diguanylate cyclase [Anaerolineaceae bacterium]